MQRSRVATALRPIAWVGLVALLAIYLFPLYWLVNTSLKPRAELFGSTPTLVAQQPTLEP
jgi:ABC-type glycerol-3-phosphate transport system permease component